MRELLFEIWASVRRNKLRTALTGFSVAWGIFMLVILLGSGNGLKNGVTSNFGSYAKNSIRISGGRTSKEYMGYDKNRHILLKNSDLEIIRREFPEVVEIAAQAWFWGKTISYGNQHMTLSLCGALPKLAQIEGIELLSGRFINQTDITLNRKVLVVDEGTQRILFHGNNPLGKQVVVAGSTYTIVGVYKGDPMRTEALNYAPLSTTQLIFNANNPTVNSAIFTLRDIDTDQAMESFEKRLISRLAKEHHFDPEDRSTIWLNNRMEQYKNMQFVFNGINIFVWIIGLGTLFAGIVGVSNIMLVTVTERTNEFGIRKALGARPASIIRLILAESMLITAAFGYIGMVLGIGVMEVVNYVIVHSAQSAGKGPATFLNPTLDLRVTVSATIVLIIAGLIAGYIPAYRAAQLKTIDALRYNK